MFGGETIFTLSWKQTVRVTERAEKNNLRRKRANWGVAKSILS